MVYVWDVHPADICHNCWHGRSEEKVGELEQRGFFRSGGAKNFESKTIINSIGKLNTMQKILEYWCIYCKHRCVFVHLCFCVFLSTCSWCVQYVQIRLRTSRLRWEIDALIAMELGGSTENGGNLPRSYQPVGMQGLWRSTSNLRYGVFWGCWLSLFESLVFNLWAVFPFCLDQFRRKCISRVALGKNSKKKRAPQSQPFLRWSGDHSPR